MLTEPAGEGRFTERFHIGNELVQSEDDGHSSEQQDTDREKNEAPDV